MWYQVVLVIHVLIAAGLVGLVLLQHGKGADAGAAFGAGASSTVFGSQGSANFLSRSTAVLATVFFLTSLSLAYMAGHRERAASVMEQAAPAVEEAPPAEAPKAPADLPPAPAGGGGAQDIPAPE
jgi:preprotein translocase subunit SecG